MDHRKDISENRHRHQTPGRYPEKKKTMMV
jgi:hypothetical protein